MSTGAFIEPLMVITLLFGGDYVNRNSNYKLPGKRSEARNEKTVDHVWEYSSDGSGSPFPRAASVEEGLLSSRLQEESSRLRIKFPFLVEIWYWAHILALTLVEGTVNVARRHALQVIYLEQRLRIFWEPAIQRAFLKHETAMHWINRIYCFIHIPGTIFFLAWLYYYTTVRNRVDERQAEKDVGEVAGSPGGPALYQARRRTLAVCNLLAFIVFTAWPCMPPRLLSDPSARGVDVDQARLTASLTPCHAITPLRIFSPYRSHGCPGPHGAAASPEPHDRTAAARTRQAPLDAEAPVHARRVLIPVHGLHRHGRHREPFHPRRGNRRLRLRRCLARELYPTEPLAGGGLLPPVPENPQALDGQPGNRRAGKSLRKRPPVDFGHASTRLEMPGLYPPQMV
ncbi:hypothetical protein DL771_006071 [Monosporascus sp. 5C6A]|nr:hypothetical protein DL771_006071 [Monosporascus sp. 5C6A]